MAINEQARRNAQIVQGMSTRYTPTSMATVPQGGFLQRVGTELRQRFPQASQSLRRIAKTPVNIPRPLQTFMRESEYVAQQAARGGSRLVPFAGNYLYERAIKPSMGGEIKPQTALGEIAGKVAYVTPSAITLRGAPGIGLRYGGISAGISGGITKATGGSFTEGAIEGFVNAPTIAMIGTITNPIIKNAVKITGKNITNPVTKQLVVRSLSSLLNVAEGIPMDAALGKKPLSTQSILIDSIAGFLLTPGANEDLVKAVGDLQKNKLKASKESILKVQEALQTPENKELIKRANDSLSGPTLETIAEESTGFAPGMREQFDTALLTKNKEQVSKLLSDVPDEYKQRFKTEIEIVTGQKLPAPDKPETKQLLNKIVKNFEIAQEARTRQEASYKTERAQRVAIAEKLGETLSGKELQEARKGVLSGEFGKVEVKPEDTITKADTDYLFNEIENTRDLTFFERLRAKDAVEQLFTEGKPPIQSDLNILKRIYGNNFAEEIKKNSKSFKMGLGEQIIETLGLTRALTTIGDFSAIFRQGLWFSTRKDFWNNVPNAFRYAFDPKYTRQQMEAIYDLESIRAQAEIPVGQRLAITELEGGLSKGEEAFLGSAIINKIPVLGKIARASERSYVGFLNSLRASAYETMYQEAKKSGALDADPMLLSKLAGYVNSATGRGNLNDLPESAQGIMNAILFSPRLQKSRIDLLNPFKFPMMGSFIRQQYAKDLISNLTLGLTVLGIAKLAGAEVGDDPTSADFGKIKVGNTRVDIWGGFQQYAVLLSRLWWGRKTSSVTGIESEFTGALDILKGDFSKGSGFNPNNMLSILTDFAENKSSPNTRLFLSLFRGLKDPNGNKLSFPTELLNSTVPLILQQFVEAYNQEGLGFATATTLPATIGFNVATYGDQVPRIGETDTGAPRIEYAYEPTFGDIVKEKLAGIPYTTLSQQEQEILVAKRNRETANKLAIQEAKKRVKETGKSEIAGGKEIRLVQGEPTDFDLKEISYQPQDPAIAVEDDLLAESFFRNITATDNVPQELLNYLDKSPDKSVSGRVIYKLYKNDPKVVNYLEERGLFTEEMANRIVLEKAKENPQEVQSIIYKRLNNLVSRKEEIDSIGADLILQAFGEGIMDNQTTNKAVSDYKNFMTNSAKNKLIGDVAVYKMDQRTAPISERESYLKLYINEIKTKKGDVGSDAFSYLIKLYEQGFLPKASITKILQGERLNESTLEKYKQFIKKVER